MPTNTLNKPGTKAHITPAQKRLFFERLDAGYSIAASYRHAGFSARTADRILKGQGNRSGQQIREARQVSKLRGPILYDDLCEEAQRAFHDFGYFQRRYLGRVPIYWQIEAAQIVVEELAKDSDSWLDINAPPGTGKSTTFTHDIPAWLTVRDRAITGMLGSAIQGTAESYLRRLKDTLERVVPVKGDPRLIKLGLACDAEATLAGDYGRFKAPNGIWAADQILVEQFDGVAVAEKEASWSAFGRKGGVLGMRFRFVMWDDLADPKRLKSEELVEEDQEWYIDVAESRLEPGGTFVNQGQRLGQNDLHRFALNMRVYVDDEDDDELEPEVHDANTDVEYYGEEVTTDIKPKYRHIKYKAHYEELCVGNHKKSSPAYGEPGGCLLYPRRLTWTRLSAIILNRINRFLVLYQQEDVDPDNVLVQKEWIDGGGDNPGCWDYDRDRLQVPELAPERLAQCLSVATVDPSPSKYWSIQWWLYDPVSKLRYLIDLERKSMSASAFLDWDPNANRGMGGHTGLLETWQTTSVQLGIPIEYWIVESNAAQKFLLQYNHVKTWVARHGVSIRSHETHKNKSDTAYGVQTIGAHYQWGRVRLPGKPGSLGKVASLKLRKEVTEYPYGTTTDCVMGHWFFEWWLPYLSKRKRQVESPPPEQPDWIVEDMKANMALLGLSQ